MGTPGCSSETIVGNTKAETATKTETEAETETETETEQRQLSVIKAERLCRDTDGADRNGVKTKD